MSQEIKNEVIQEMICPDDGTDLVDSWSVKGWFGKNKVVYGAKPEMGFKDVKCPLCNRMYIVF